ncbi:ROK family protein [Microlunatus panaciterrae]|uniref:NBD/HSP70 family sugar kinase n=1 Tax=Microlunatus panaciterrae TaxID=400768 RepID=A0ABS2RG32_9ACTN|nr:ROK family protein [Microlunatus panaciterrae]MBM7797487.1 putative NBD/HSP70 family sugar kinase [Microlunatus panaciterrae]
MSDGSVSATPQLLRRVNATAVLTCLRSSPAMTGTDLIRATGLTRATIHGVCNDLISMGWIREVQPGRRPGEPLKGRPARLYEFDQRAGHVVGIDMGAHRVTALLADLRGHVLGRATMRFPGVEIAPEERIQVVDDTALRALEQAGVDPSSILAVGIGVAAPVDRAGRVISGEGLWDLIDVDLPGTLQRRHGWTVLMDNDANLAAVAERWRGVAGGVDHLAVVLAGERLGAGLIDSGRILRGHTGAAGEMGFLSMIDGVQGAEGLALLARSWGVEALTSGADGELRSRTGGDTQAVTAELVFAAARAGDRAALDILDRIATRLARVIATLASLLNPELVVLAGAVADASAAILPLVERDLPGFTATPPRVAASTLGADVVALGGLRRALDRVEDTALELPPRRLTRSTRSAAGSGAAGEEVRVT